MLHLSSAAVCGRIALAYVLTFMIGFEREVRGSPAGDRTFSLIGVGSAIVALLALANAPQALAGVVTGVGFIGAGVVVRQTTREGERIQGVTTAATIFATAAIGAAAGQGVYIAALMATALVLFTLELRNVPVLRVLDARRWASRFADDELSLPIPADRDQGPGDQPPAR